MSQRRESVTQGREAYRRESTKGRSLISFLLIGTAVVVANLLFVYEQRSIRDAVIVALLWMVVYPLIGYWRYSKKPR
jgi:hypothetical protein